MSNRPPAKRPFSHRLEARVVRVVNVPMRRILGLPFATPLGRRLMLLRLTGRKTGRIYKQPVSYVRQGDGTLLTPGGGRWTLNLTEGRAMPIRLRGRDITAAPELISDPGQVETLLETMIRINPATSWLVRIPRDESGRLNRPALENALDHGFRIVRWHLNPTDLPDPN